MKKRIALLVLLLVPLALWAADPVHEGYARAVGSVTVDSTFDQLNWELLGTGILYKIVTGGGTVVFNVTGVAVMDPGDKLWLGIGNDTLAGVSGAFATRNRDSMCIKHPLHNKGVGYYPFDFSAVLDTAVLTNGDTVYFSAACGGTGFTDKIELLNVVTSVTVIDSQLAL